MGSVGPAWCRTDPVAHPLAAWSGADPDRAARLSRAQLAAALRRAKRRKHRRQGCTAAGRVARSGVAAAGRRAEGPRRDCDRPGPPSRRSTRRSMRLGEVVAEHLAGTGTLRSTSANPGSGPVLSARVPSNSVPTRTGSPTRRAVRTTPAAPAAPVTSAGRSVGAGSRRGTGAGRRGRRSALWATQRARRSMIASNGRTPAPSIPPSRVPISTATSHWTASWSGGIRASSRTRSAISACSYDSSSSSCVLDDPRVDRGERRRVLDLKADTGRDPGVVLQPAEGSMRVDVGLRVPQVRPGHVGRRRALGEPDLGHPVVALPGLVEPVRRSKSRGLQDLCSEKKIQLFRSPVSPSGMRRTPAGIRASSCRSRSWRSRTLV